MKKIQNTSIILILFLAGVNFLSTGCKTSHRLSIKPDIIQKGIQWDNTREALSIKYMREHHGIEADQAVIDPKMIVVHWTATTTFEDAFNVFDPSELHGRPDIEEASNLNVSVPFLVDRNGFIYQLMPETRFGRHVIGLNYCAIGIENVGNGGSHPLTRKQLKSNVRLIRYLMSKYSVEYVIGHHEYLNFKYHKLYRESDPDYFTVKTDPGDQFMKKLFRRLGLNDSYRKPH